MIGHIPFVAKRPPGPRPWVEFGASEPLYRRWSPHICAIACCRSLILAARAEAPSLWELTRKGIEMGVFVETPNGISGAFHLPLISLLEDFGIKATRFGLTPESDLWRIAEQCPLMLSIDLSKLPSAGTGSHLVLVEGRTSDRYRILDNAYALDRSGTAELTRANVSAISNGKGLIITPMAR